MPTWGNPAILDVILSFAAIVIVPLALKLTHDGRSGPHWVITIAVAVFFSVGLLFSGGTWAAAMAVPWFLATVGLLLRAAIQARGFADASLKAVTNLAAHLFLVVGAVWAIAACGGHPVLGFDSVIVQLTAVHFHYAGFALPILALKTVDRSPGRVADVSLLLILGGVPAVAAGIAARSASAKFVATLILTVGCVLVAARQFRAAFTIDRPASRTLLALSAVCLMSGMALAALYAVGQLAGRDWIDIPTMITTHGVANALGFAFCGLVGWLTAMADRAIIPGDCHARTLPARERSAGARIGL